MRDAIQREMLQASGSEVGGILLGRHEGDEVVVEDFEPAPSEHRFGRYYFLSDEDLGGLAESVDWFRTLPASQAEKGLEVLGFFRSRVRPDSSWNERDEDLMRRFFADSGSLLALVKSNPGDTFDAEIFVLEEGSLRPVGPRPAPAETRPSERPAALPPATRPRLREPEETPDRSWWWVAALVTLTLVGAVLGYRSVRPPPASTPVKPQPAKAQPQAPAAAIPQAQPQARSAAIPQPPAPAPAVSPSMERGIQSAIERWQHAILSGDPNLIAACYAPQLERYYDQRNSSSARVRQAALRSVQHFGKPAILRVSELTIIPVSPDRAIATFRKHWQTRGPKVFAGEEQARLAFVLDRDAAPPSWRIVSEEETKVYWTQRPRTRGRGAR